MIGYRNSLNWRSGFAVPLILAVLLVSLGAPSTDFHEWLHGDDVDCALSHHSPVGEGSGDDPSDGGSHDTSDPLEPFCQPGNLLQVTFESPILDQPQVVESVRLQSIGGTFFKILSSRPTRAPPVLI